MSLNNLDELRNFVINAVGDGISLIRHRYLVKSNMDNSGYIVKDSNGWKRMRAIVIGKATIIIVCEKWEKHKEDKTLFKLTKKDIRYGIDDARWNSIIGKCSVYLESVGVYPKQKRISIDTPQFEQVRE